MLMVYILPPAIAATQSAYLNIQDLLVQSLALAWQVSCGFTRPALVGWTWHDGSIPAEATVTISYPFALQICSGDFLVNLPDLNLWIKSAHAHEQVTCYSWLLHGGYVYWLARDHQHCSWEHLTRFQSVVLSVLATHSKDVSPWKVWYTGCCFSPIPICSHRIVSF